MVEELKWCKCGSKHIVNKKYGLCDNCNYARLHNGKSKREVYAERSLQRISQRQANAGKRGVSEVTGVQPKKKYRIKKISDSTRYHCSDGTMVSQAEITANYRATQEHIVNTRNGVCQGTGRTDLPLSFSHIISRARCKQLGKVELIWDEANIELESMGENISAHYIWEHGDLESKKRLLNFAKKFSYIQKHDPETYRKWENS